MEKDASAETADYTINYKYNGETITSDTGSDIAIGTVINVANSKWVDGVKYMLKDGEEESITIASGSNTLNVNMRLATTYNFTVNAYAGETIIPIATGSNYEGEYANYHWAAVLNIEGTLYTAPVINSGYKGSILLDADNKEATVTYTASEDIKSLVFLAEGEDVFTKATGSAADTRGSMGAGGYQNNAKAFVTLPAGKYIMVVSNRCSGNRTAIHVFTAGAGNNAVTIFAVDGIGNNETWTSNEFTLTANTKLYFQGGSDNQWVDYLYIYKTGDVELPENVEVTVTDAGYRTYCSEYVLDFSNVTGLKAYTASIEGDEVSFVEAGKVPANTGVLLKGTGSFNVPVVTDGGDATSALVGGTTAPAGSFVLMNKDGKVGFYMTTSEFTLTANTAYIPGTASARGFIAIDGEATGISAVNAEQEGAEVYNLNGQRVSKAQKGLYIQNGKKVIMK